MSDLHHVFLSLASKYARIYQLYTREPCISGLPCITFENTVTEHNNFRLILILSGK